MKILIVSTFIFLGVIFNSSDMNFYKQNFKINTIDRIPLDLSKFKGKKIAVG